MPPPPDALPERPSTIHTADPLKPRGPWSFMKEAADGGLSKWSWQLMAAWAAFQVLTSVAWARHLLGFAKFPGSPGGSALPNNWGEHLTAKDIWELMENGGLKHEPFGSVVPLLAIACLVWVFWSGWAMQAELLGFRARLQHWFLGLLDALLIGLLPLGIVFGLARWVLSTLGGTGIPPLGWLALIGVPLVSMALVSALNLQWWLCRVDRGAGSSGLLRHWGRSFMRLWMHPVQWTGLVLGGVALRAGLAFLAIWIGWRLGGGSTSRVQLFLLLEFLSALVNAWLLGWFLRLVALFWRQDEKVREAKLELEQARRRAAMEAPMETRWPGFARTPSGEHEGDAEGAERPGGPLRSDQIGGTNEA